MLRKILATPLDKYINDEDVGADYNDLMADAEDVKNKSDAVLGKLDEESVAEDVPLEPTDELVEQETPEAIESDD